ncbi:MAG: hypothetical protein J7L59_01220 [Nanoarchaeota archaeon]|nr:hypothetical protein [Nanoarchaeota archaeon]
MDQEMKVFLKILVTATAILLAFDAYSYAQDNDKDLFLLKDLGYFGLPYPLVLAAPWVTLLVYDKGRWKLWIAGLLLSNFLNDALWFLVDFEGWKELWNPFSREPVFYAVISKDIVVPSTSGLIILSSSLRVSLAYLLLRSHFRRAKPN